MGGLAAGTYRVTLVMNGAALASINNTPATLGSVTELNFRVEKTRHVKQAKHLIWVPGGTESRLGGRWVEVAEGAAAASASNSNRASGEQLKQQVPTPGVGPHQDDWARRWIWSTH